MRRALHALTIAALLAATGIAATGDILDATDTVHLTMAAPLLELFSRATDAPDASVTGQLTWQHPSGRSVTLSNVEVAERGHTSRQRSECAFPKLRLDLTGAQRDNTPFAGIDVLKIGTHCGDADDSTLTPKYGRLANEHAPRREALVYRLVAAAGVPTLRARPARITYDIESDTARQSLTRYALLLEDDDEARRRLEATGEWDEATFGAASIQFDPDVTARLAFAEAMIGNFDWCLRMFPGDIYRCDDRHPLWNVLAFRVPGSKDLPLPYDFDLSGPVVGRHVWFPQIFDERFADPPSSVHVEVLSQLQRTRSLFGRARLDATRAHFLQRRSAVMEAIDTADVDETGRRLAHEYVDTFYDIIGADARFYQPVVAEGGHTAFRDATGTQPACGGRSLIPAGTPVSAPLERKGSFVRVRLLDALWEWTGDNTCDAVRREPVWVDASAIGTEYPR